MNFISWAFVLLFIPVFLARMTIGRNRTERAFLWFVIAASTVFVCWYVPAYIAIMLVSIGVDFVAAIAIDGAPPGSISRKIWLAGSMTTNLALLGFFKYADFVLAMVHRVAAPFQHHQHTPHVLGILLPIGISFYTFGSMSYTIDVYRGIMKPVGRFRDFYFFLTFFPHMVAGPIIRAEQFFYQMPRRRRLSVRVFNEGGYQIIRGLFLKMVCADNIAGVVNDGWIAGSQPITGSLHRLVLAVLFAAQIFCDFEGYTSIARGLAYWLGFRFPINFNNPYIARSFSNFWERWHITLSSWLRDYLYIPLGGNRRGAVRTYVNLIIVMALGGLWHGAATTFVIWGLLHGAALAVERLIGLNRTCGRLVEWTIRPVWFVIVQATVLVAWVFFRSESVRESAKFVAGIVRLQPGPIPKPVSFALWFVLPVLIMHGHGRLVEAGWLRPIGRISQAVMAAVLLGFVLTCYGTSSEFIYFHF
jgi:alginate O-acetyltransferase complex protein AlgI